MDAPGLFVTFVDSPPINQKIVPTIPTAGHTNPKPSRQYAHTTNNSEPKPHHHRTPDLQLQPHSHCHHRPQGL